MNVYKSFFRRLTMLFVVVVGGLLSQSVVAQTVKGRVTDAITGEPLIGAAVQVVELQGVGGFESFIKLSRTLLPSHAIQFSKKMKLST